MLTTPRKWRASEVKAVASNPFYAMMMVSNRNRCVLWWKRVRSRSLIATFSSSQLMPGEKRKMMPFSFPVITIQCWERKKITNLTNGKPLPSKIDSQNTPSKILFRDLVKQNFTSYKSSAVLRVVR